MVEAFVHKVTYSACLKDEGRKGGRKRRRKGNGCRMEGEEAERENIREREVGREEGREQGERERLIYG
jgi:hypothetical protein